MSLSRPTGLADPDLPRALLVSSEGAGLNKLVVELHRHDAHGKVSSFCVPGFLFGIHLDPATRLQCNNDGKNWEGASQTGSVS